MAESKDDSQADEARLKGLRAQMAKMMAMFKKEHPGAFAHAHVRVGNNAHAFDENGEMDMNPNSGLEVESPMEEKADLPSIAQKIYPRMK